MYTRENNTQIKHVFRDISLISQQLGFIVTVRNRIARADFVTHEKNPT